MATTEGRATTSAEAPVRGTRSRPRVAGRLGVDPRAAFGAARPRRGCAQYGPNKFAEAAVGAALAGLLRQYRDPMQIVLLVARRSAACTR